MGVWVRGGGEDRRAPDWEGGKECLSELKGLLEVGGPLMLHQLVGI